jgi:hypothetical protein
MWQPALFAAIVGFFTLTGTLVGHRWQATENMKIRLEQYEREDRYRLFGDRLEAYKAFHEAISTKARPAIISYQRANRDHSLMPAMQQAAMDAFSTFVVVRLIGDGDVVLAAAQLMREVDGIVWREDKNFDSDHWSNLVLDFIRSARKDLVRQDDSTSEWIVFKHITSGPQFRLHTDESGEILGPAAAAHQNRIV